ncbi:MAG: substrate-binding domain-containing protein [Oscillospiraceae bacterium]|nr:substrate-binding domain-containing protein [Oscillospiraceae bacterium]
MKKGRSKMLRLAAFSAAVMMAANLTGCGITVPTTARDAIIGCKIVVIGQAKDIQFWDYVEQGAVDAGNELQYDVEYVSAANTNDIDGQIQLIQNAVSNGAKAIVLAPNSRNQLNNAISEAREKGIVVITIDADIDDTELRTSYIGSINASAASIAARKVADYLLENKVNGKHGRVGIISHSETSAAAEQRVGPFQGSLMTLLGYSSGSSDALDGSSAGAQQGGAPSGTQGGAPSGTQGGAPSGTQGGAPSGTQGGAPAGAQGGNPVIASIQYCAGEQDRAKNIATKMIETYPDLKVLYATNEKSTLGVCEAVKAARAKDMAMDVMVVGYNANTTEIGYINSDILTGTMLQNPYNMGYLGVYYAGQELVDQSAPGTVDTGVVYVHKKNLHNDDIQLLLDPKSFMKNKQ